MTVVTKPTDSADWATTEQINPVSGESNYVEPPSTQIEFGWTYLQKPPRQYFNWWQRVVGLWVRYLEYRATQEPLTDAGASGVTLTSTSDNIQTFTPAGAITVKLDNSFVKGVSITIVNKGAFANAITVTANDNTVIGYIQGLSSGLFKSLADAPAINTSWARVGVGMASATLDGLIAGSGTQSIGGIKNYPDNPGAYGLNTSGQTGLVSGTATKVLYNSETFDVGSYLDTATGRYTPPAGRYIFCWSVGLASGTANQLELARAYLCKNGNTTDWVGSGGVWNSTATPKATSFGSTGSVIVEANGTDYYELFGLAITGSGTWSISGATAANTYLSVSKIG